MSMPAAPAAQVAGQSASTASPSASTSAAPAPAAAAATAATGVASASSLPVNRKPLFLSATLSGRNEVPVAGGPAVGDPDGSARGLVEIKGTRVTFAFSWRGITAPTLGHIHQGTAGINGGVKVPLFTTAMPATATAAAGSVSVDDPNLVKAIRSDPTGFYLNLHSSEFPGGAVRGQLHPLGYRISPLRLLSGLPLHAFLDGGQEVPVANGPAVGDPDGHAVGFVRSAHTRISYAFAWIGLTPPTLGHIHEGVAGVNGPVKVPLIATAVPANIFAIAGTVTGVDPALAKQIRHHPSGFYLNLHTAEFPGGATRGQLFRTGVFGHR
jgi:hypothetical protein